MLVGFRSGLEASYFQPVTKTGSINYLLKSSILLKIVVLTLAPLRVSEAELHYSKGFLAIWDRVLNKLGLGLTSFPLIIKGNMAENFSCTYMECKA